MPRACFLALLALATLALGACTSKLVNVSRHPLLVDADPTMDEAEAAIRAGAEKRGWVVAKEAPGVLVATLSPRRHVAVIEIKHDATHFDIDYRSSEKLGDSGRGRGYIHPNYNRWVNNLVFDISGQEIPKPPRRR